MSEPVFPKEEFERRHDRARAAMAADNLRALIAYGHGNQFWLSGFIGSGGPQPVSAFLDTMVSPRIVLPIDGEPALLGLKSAGEAYALETHIADIRPMISPPGERPRLIRAVLDERGIRTGRVGIDLSSPAGVTPGELDHLRAALSHLELVDATALFTRLRMIKTPAEIACLRRAVEIQNAAFRAFIANASRKMSDLDLRFELLRAQMAAGAADLGLTLTAGHPAAALFGAPSEVPVERNGLRWFDSGASYRGYMSDYDILVSWGEPGAEAIAVHASLRDAYAEAMTAWRPGRAAADIARDTIATLARHGIADVLGGAFVGHCLGCEVVERPWFGARAPKDLVLEPGMVIAPEWLNRTSLGDFLWEENFLVTETGLERLSDFPDTLAVIDA